MGEGRVLSSPPVPFPHSMRISQVLLDLSALHSSCLPSLHAPLGDLSINGNAALKELQTFPSLEGKGSVSQTRAGGTMT